MAGCLDIFVVVIEELRANGTVEPFDIGIGLGVSGVIVEVFDGAVANGDSEVFFELAAVIGLDTFDGKRCDRSEFIQEVFGVSAVEGGIGVGEGKSADQVNGRDDKPFHPFLKYLKRVHLDEVS